MKSYSEKLKDPRWQKRRLQILEKARWTCVYCESETKSLHVHHLFYEKGKDPWEYEDSMLMVLCQDCHKSVAEIQKDITLILAEFPPWMWADLHAALCDVRSNPSGHPWETWSKWMEAAHWQKKRKAA